MFPKMEKEVPTDASSTQHPPTAIPIDHIPLKAEEPKLYKEVEQKENVEPTNGMDIANIFEMLPSLSEKDKVDLKDKIWKPTGQFQFPRNSKKLKCSRGRLQLVNLENSYRRSSKNNQEERAEKENKEEARSRLKSTHITSSYRETLFTKEESTRNKKRRENSTRNQ